MADAPKLAKTAAEWQAELTPEQYAVARCSATERPFSGAYWDTKTPGLYRCICCHTALFRSDQKYDSGSGWPSFWAPVAADVIATREDTQHGMRRVEILCARCDAHLGHVFPDGPQPTGLRFCVNSASLDLEPDASA